ncbi:Enterobactin exporter EntS [Brevundimonas sp. NIBR10]|uniref:MFS transporter n=1 Tax=Brevundimonas sp. NIBR10 TaxID=3015997 RepID=UPI0022F1BCCC|nr:MFS transporter [Brevundimonas sp. NIBR10]WGM47335.1 Enterobactin exporter EntS [Brevundimonas sp. NIBR10]
MAGSTNLLAPFATPVFRRIWLASLLTNFGILIQGVGAAWTMSKLTSDASMVAMVQTALMLPMMLFALPAGAISDMFDRRLVCILALLLAFVGAMTLSCLSFAGLLTPWILLGFCFIVGTSMALFSPAWQSSVAEQVPVEALAPAIALTGISYNVARSFGPAIGGVIVAAFGAIGAFVANAVAYVPLLIVLFLWKRKPEPARLAPETFWRAIVSGLRFIRYSPSHRLFILRTAAFGLIGGVAPALTPLIAKDLLGGGATVYGVLLGAFGLGAVAGAVVLPWIRKRCSTETASRLSAAAMAGALLLVGLSRNEALGILGMLVAGLAWTTVLTLYSISVQISAPRWVAGRALAIYQATITGGVAMGAIAWGQLVNLIGVQQALVTAASLMAASIGLGFIFRLPDLSHAPALTSLNRADPEIVLDLTLRSGPIVIEIDYVTPEANARAFYDAMQKVRRFRQGMGAYGWSIARDIADATRWTERFHSPTWNDYLHLSQRATSAGREVLEDVRGLLEPSTPVRVRRMLERPAGSVRSTDDVRDAGGSMVTPVGPRADGT